MRRLVISIIAALAIVVAVGGAVMAGTGGGSSVTQPRLERALAAQFANLYSDQATLLGHRGVTPSSLHAKAMCDKGGAVEVNVGPGSNWNCLMGWTDPNVPMPPEGYGKFEVTAHTNGCYTAGGPSKLVGFQTISDTHGRQGTVTATSGPTSLGKVPFGLKEQQTGRIAFAHPVPHGAKDVTFTFDTVTRVGPSSPSTISMPAS